MNRRSCRARAGYLTIVAIVLVIFATFGLGSCDIILDAAIRAAGAYAQKELMTFSFEAAHNGAAGLTSDCVGVISGATISVTLPYIPDVTALVATFTTTGVEVRVGSTTQVSGTTPNDFTSPVMYIVVAADSTTKSYAVTVTVAANTAKDLTALSFEAARNSGAGLTTDCSGVITGTNISVTVPYIPDVTALVATFATTGVEVKVGSTVQVSGTTSNDFTNPVTYVVTAADSTTRSYIATVTVNPWHTIGMAGFSADVATKISLAIDTSGTPYVAFSGFSESANNRRATVMKYESGAWQTVGQARFSAVETDYISLAIDTSGIPFVAFNQFNYSEKATVMKLESGSWQVVGTPDFTPNHAWHLSLAIDSSGIPYVAFADWDKDGKATVMKYEGEAWQVVGTAGFSADDASFTSLAIDSSDTPYVGYRDSGNSTKATVMKYESGSWQVVGAAGFSAGQSDYTSLAIDPTDTPYLAYMDGASDGKATVMKYACGEWQVVGTAGFSMGHAGEISLSIDSSGTPYVAYKDQANGYEATVTKFESNSWQTVGQAGFSAGEVTCPSLAVDSSGAPYVAYQDKARSGKATVMKFR